MEIQKIIDIINAGGVIRTNSCINNIVVYELFRDESGKKESYICQLTVEVWDYIRDNYPVIVKAYADKNKLQLKKI